jgi:hypothetical protein
MDGGRGLLDHTFFVQMHRSDRLAHHSQAKWNNHRPVILAGEPGREKQKGRVLSSGNR